MNSDSIFKKFQMNIDVVQNEIDTINNYLKNFLWMDFDFSYIGQDKIILNGSLDQSWNENRIEIEFLYPQFLSSVFNWSMDEKKPFILLSSSQELYENTRFSSEEGCYVFKMNDNMSEDYRIFISAGGIKCNILEHSN